MSAIAYGRLVRRNEQRHERFLRHSEEERTPAALAEEKEKEKENRLVTAVAALVPADIIALHALVLAVTTSKADDGSTTILKPEILKWSLVVLALTALGAFVIARGMDEWKSKDWARALLPPLAFILWTGLTGTSALSPWVTGVDPALVVLGAGALAVLLIALNAKINPPKEE